MTMTSRSCVLGTRVSSGTKARFAALAAHHRLSESALLAQLVGEVLRAHSPPASESDRSELAHVSTADEAASDRLTLRLRNGDRTLAAERARARGMKTGSYLAMLIHNHVRSPAVLPPHELDLLRSTCAQLAALGRRLRMLGTPTGPEASELREAIAWARRETETAREAAAAVVRRNLLSWETGSEIGSETGHA